MSLASRLNERLPAAWQDIDPPEGIGPRDRRPCAMMAIGGVPIYVGEVAPSEIGSDCWFCCPGDGLNWRRWETLLVELPHVVAHLALNRARQTPPVSMPVVPAWAAQAFTTQRLERLTFINNRTSWANRLIAALNEERGVLEVNQ